MRLKKGVIVQEMGDTFVAYDNENSTIHELNETGFFILSLIKNGKNKSEIIVQIQKEYGIPGKKAQNDFGVFVNLLKTKNLIEEKR